MAFLHNGMPKTVRKAEWKTPEIKTSDFSPPKDLTPFLHKILAARVNKCVIDQNMQKTVFTALGRDFMTVKIVSVNGMTES